MSVTTDHTTIIEDMLSRALEGGTRDLSLPAARYRELWQSIDRDIAEAVVREGMDAISRPWSKLLLSDYTDFARTGNRVRFEELQFSRRIKLSALVLAECVRYDATFMGAILDGLDLILRESSWCHPAHNSHARGGHVLGEPDRERPVIDLFAAETAADLAVAEYLLREEVSGTMPGLHRAIDEALEERIFTPYLNEHFWWMGDGMQPMCNWTVWITENVLLSALTRPDEVLSRGRKEAVMRQAAASIDYFLDGYGEDGACEEGAEYYGHATLCMWGALSLLDEATEGGMAAAFRDERIRNMAAYIARVHVTGPFYVNYGDCATRTGERSVREYLCGAACELPELEALAAEDMRAQSMRQRLMPDGQDLWYRLLQMRYMSEALDYTADAGEISRDFFFRSTGLMVARDDEWFLAVKAGHNGEDHGHNDVGGVIVYRHGRPFLIDLGVETYTSKTFSGERYTLMSMRSAYHSVPVFLERGADNWIEQSAGVEHAARDVKCVMDSERCSLSMELAGAYADERIGSYRREVTLLRGEGIRIRDEHRGGDETVSPVFALMTCEEPVRIHDQAEEAASPCASGADLGIRLGSLGVILISGTDPDGMTIDEIPITDERLSRSWQGSCYRIRVPMTGDVLEAVLR